MAGNYRITAGELESGRVAQADDGARVRLVEPRLDVNRNECRNRRGRAGARLLQGLTQAPQTLKGLRARALGLIVVCHCQCALAFFRFNPPMSNGTGC